MDNIIKLPPNPFPTSAFTIFSDCCLRFSSQAHSFDFASTKIKPNIFKNRLFKTGHRSRLHHSECTNLDTNGTNCIEIENVCAFKEGTESPFQSNANSEPLEKEVIRKASSLPSFDPVKVEKDKGLLDDEELGRSKVLEKFVYKHRFNHGFLVVKLLGREHMEDTSQILSDALEEHMWGPVAVIFMPLTRFATRERMLERRALVPHAVTLVGLYAEREGEWTLGGTVEVSLNSKGADEFPATPVPPKSSPYLSNMAVNKSLRRRGIGWQLLKASEELVTQMGSNEMYLHCRTIDTAAFNMYTKAGYYAVQTDNILSLFMLQRPTHLMYKKLPVQQVSK